MHTQLGKLVTVCERAEARAQRKLAAAHSRESACRQDVARAELKLERTQQELLNVDRAVAASEALSLHHLQSAERYRDGLREAQDRLRDVAANTRRVLAIAVRERSELSKQTLSASAKLDIAQRRVAQWRRGRDAIRLSQQEELAVEAWHLRLR